MPFDHSRRWVSPFEEPESSAASLAVFLTQKAYSEAVTHAASNLDIEVGGVLVGTWHTQAQTGRLFIVAENALPARFTRQGNVYLTFTQDSLVDLHTEMDEHYPGKQIVGWYHTHPRMGVFLSHYDTWLHRYFFPEPWQVALVIEPFANLGGFFVRQADGALDPSRYFGFYELDGTSGRSIVHWHNLQSDLDSIEPEGDESNE
jgi:proteasome lid subunit RPN8/RPN11